MRYRVLLVIMFVTLLHDSVALCESQTFDWWCDNPHMVASYQPCEDAGILPTGYYVQDDILYCGSTLYRYPGQKEQPEFAIPEGVYEIERDAFPNVIFDKLYIPASCISFGCDENYCINVLALPKAGSYVVSPNNPLFSSVDGLLLSKDGTKLLLCPYNYETVNIPDGVTTIGERAFAGSAITEIRLPDSVTHLNNACFAQCEFLSKLDLGGSLIYIGDETFEGCMSLETLLLPESLRYIGSNAFAYSSIQHLDLPDNIEILDYYAFYGTQIEEIVLPASLTYIAEIISHENTDRTLSPIRFSVYENSYAHNWALAQELPFLLIPIGNH